MKKAINIALWILFLSGCSLCFAGCLGELMSNPLKWN